MYILWQHHTLVQRVNKEMLSVAGGSCSNSVKFCGNVFEEIQIDHFRVAFGLCFKTSPRAKPFIWKRIWFTWNFNLQGGAHFHMNGFAWRLDLAPRQKATAEMACCRSTVKSWNLGLVGMTFCLLHQMRSYIQLTHSVLLKICFPCTINVATRVRIFFCGPKLH